MGTYLILRSSAPVLKSRGVRDAFLEAVRTEGAEGYGGCAVDAADGPEWWRHFRLIDVVCVLCGGAVVGVGMWLRCDEVRRCLRRARR